MKGKKNPETFGRKWRYLFMILALVFSVGVSAQKTVVKGNILDKDNLPVIGANILEKGTTNGTISDVDGNFTITVSDPKAVLLIKYIGYKDVEKVVSPTMKIPFWMVYSVIPFSGGLSMVYIARNFIRKLRTPAEILSKYNNTPTEGADQS